MEPVAAVDATTGEEVEHVDVLIVGAGLSGIGAACHLQRALPRQELRDPRGARRDRRHLGPVPLPGHPLGLRHVHARLPLPAVGGRRRRSPTAPRSSTTSRETAREHGIDRHDPLRPPRRARRVVERRRALDGRGRARPATGETVPAHLRLPLRLHRLLPLRRGLHARVRRASSASRGTIVHPQHWPEDLDYAGKRVVVIGSGATAVTLVPALAEQAAHVTMLQRSPTYIVSLPGRATRSPTALRRVLPARAAYSLIARWKNVAAADGSSTSSAAAARGWCEKLLRRRRARRCRPATTSTPTSTRATTPGTSASAWSPTATCSRRSARGPRRVVTDAIETFTETRHAARVRRGARGRHRRHRHRAEPALPRRHGRSSSTGATVDLPETRGLQGHDAQRRPEPRLRARLHERVVDAEVRPRPASTSAGCSTTWTSTATPRARRARPGPDVERSRSSTSRRATCCARSTSSRSRASKAPWRLHQNYARDLLMLHYGSLEDGAMEFSGENAGAGGGVM